MTHRFKSILAATDLTATSINAAERAAMVARSNGLDRISLMHVTRPYWAAQLGHQAARGNERARLALARIAAEVLRSTGVHAEIVVTAGDPIAALAEASKRHDLVVLGTSLFRPLRDALFGTTASRLIARTPASVLVVRERPQADYARALAALDFSGFDDAVVHRARAVAPAARLRLLHVVEAALEGKLDYAGVQREVIERYRSSRLQEAMQRMYMAAGRMAGEASRSVRPGPVGATLLGEAEAIGADLVVVGHPPRGWLARMATLRTAQRVLGEAACDVLVVH